MSKNRFIIVSLAAVLLFGTTLLAMGDANSTKINVNNTSCSTKQTDSPLLGLSDGQYNVTIGAVSSYASGYNYATLNFDNGDRFVGQIRPTSQLQAINMLTMLNSAHQNQEKVQIYIIGGYISAVVERGGFTDLSSKISTRKTAPAPKIAIQLPDDDYTTTIDAVYSTHDGRNYAALNTPKTWVQFDPTSQLQAINMLTMLNSAYWEKEDINVTTVDGYIDHVSNVDKFKGAS